MAAYSDLIANIQSIVKQNFNEEITGTNLQEVLLNMVSTLGIREFRGVASPSTQPAAVSGQAMYIAAIAGQYQYFGIEVQNGEIALIIWNPVSQSWYKETVVNGLGDKTFNHVQSNPASQWVINHNLGKYPSVTVRDSSGTEVEGETNHTSNNQVILNFSAAFSGTADLN